MKQGKVFMKTGKLKLQSVTIYDPTGAIAAEKTFERFNNAELPPVFQKPGEYTLIFTLHTGEKISRKLLVL